MSSLSNDAILALLKDEEQRVSTSKSGTRGPKVDPTLDRTIPTWTKLNHHHMCDDKCEHRQERGDGLAPPTQACWNHECKDTRALDDVGRRIVIAVKDQTKTPAQTQYICRYCFLAGYLLPAAEV